MTAAEPAVDAGLLDASWARRVRASARPLSRLPLGDSRRPPSRARSPRRSHRSRRDPDRRAWHRARATADRTKKSPPNWNVRPAVQQARGGVAAAAAFLERAAALSPDLAKRARRSLAAAEAKQVAGAPQAAATLLAAADDGPLDELESAMALRLKGQIALDLRRGGEAAPFMLDAAAPTRGHSSRRLARDTYLDAMRAAASAVASAQRCSIRRPRPLATRRRRRGRPRAATCCSQGWQSASPTGMRPARAC